MTELNDAMASQQAADAITCAANVVASYISNNSLSASEMPDLISAVHRAFKTLSNGAKPSPAVPTPGPAVPVKKSITRDALICLEDGRKFVSLRRHLATLGMTPDQYWAKWGLPKDYPMVAPAYSEKRSALAKAIGLGRPRTATKSVAAYATKADAVKETKRPGRPRKPK